MGTTAQKLQNIVNCKSAIQTAVRNSFSKWGIVLPDKLSDWADKLTNVRTVKITGNVDAYRYQYAYGSVNPTYNYTKQPFADTITTVDLSEIGNVNESGFLSAFQSCSSISNIIFPSQGLSPIASNAFNNMFGYCNGITNVTIPMKFRDATQVCGNMFQYCNNLEQAKLDFKFETATYTAYSFITMFRYCNKLTKFVMSGLKTLTYNNTQFPFFGSDANNAFYGDTLLSEFEINDLETFRITTAGTNLRSFGLLPTSSSTVSSVKCPDLKTISTGNYNNGYSSFFVGASRTTNTKAVSNIYLPKLTQVSPYAFNFVTNCTFHFGAENRTAIEALTNYENHFSGYGGNTTTFVFDL